MLTGREACKIFFSKSFTAQQRIVFFRQLAVILQSGLPLLRAIGLLRSRLDSDLALVCYRLQQLLTRGSTLAGAMAQEPDFFPPLAVKLVAAGEVSGQLGAVLEQLAAYYEEQERLRRFIAKAAAYPLLLLAAAACVLLFFLLYVLPVLADVYRGMRVEPQGMLAVLLRLHLWLAQYPLLALALAAGCGLLAALGCRRGLRWLWGRSWSGNFYRLIYEVRFCKLLALLLDSGLNITQAVAAVADTVSDRSYRSQLLLLNGRLQRGLDLSTALTGAEGLFSPLTQALLDVGAATGYLPRMLREAARIGEEDLRVKLAKIKEVLAPMLLLAAALVIAAVVCAVVSPLLEMLSALPA